MAKLKKRIKEIVQNSAELQKIFKNIGWLIFDKIFKYGIGLFVGIWIARYFGPKQYGVYSYALAFTSLFGAVAGLGLKGIVVRELAKEPNKSDEILGSAFLMMLSAGFFTWFFSTLTIYLMRPGDQTTFWLVTIISGSFIFQSFQTIAYYFESRVESRYIVYATNVSFVISSTLKVMLILTNKGLISFALIGLLDIILTSIILLIIFKFLKLKIINWKWDASKAKLLLKDSFPLILSGIMIMIYMKIDQIMLREMVTDKELGLYSLAVKLTELWYFVPLAVHYSVLPKISKTIRENDLASLNEILDKLFLSISSYSLIIIIGTLIFSELIINVFLGNQYAASYPMLLILMCSLLFTSMGLIRGVYLVANNYIKESFFFNFLGVVVNLILNFILIPKYGGIGSAIATLVSYSVSSYFSCFILKRLRPIGRLMTINLVAPLRLGYLFLNREKT